MKKEKEIKIDLVDLLPSKSCFKLSKFPDFEFNLEPCTAGKMIDIVHKIGPLEALLASPNAVNVSKISLMLMDYDSSLKFKKQLVKTIDVLSGEEEEAEVGGFILLTHCISGLNEQYEVYRAILESVGYKKEAAADLVKRMKDSLNKNVNNAIDEINKEDLKKKKENT